MKIAKRIKGGWTSPQHNKDKYKCDDCGQDLWIAPDGKTIYCNHETTLHKEQK